MHPCDKMLTYILVTHFHQIKLIKDTFDFPPCFKLPASVVVNTHTGSKYQHQDKRKWLVFTFRIINGLMQNKFQCLEYLLVYWLQTMGSSQEQMPLRKPSERSKLRAGLPPLSNGAWLGILSIYIKLLLANNYSYSSKKIERDELKGKWNYKENKEHPDFASLYNRTLRESYFGTD